MKTLNRKLLRDLVALKGQAIAIGLVVARGVAIFVMSSNTGRSMRIPRGALLTTGERVLNAPKGHRPPAQG